MTQQAIATFGAPVSTALLELVKPESLLDQVNRIHDTLSSRAFEIFEKEGRLFGRALDHWLRAENEVLFPVPLRVQESERELIVDAEVPGFKASDLKVSLEPRKLTITGKTQLPKAPSQGKEGRGESGFNEMLKIVDLPVEVDVLKTTAILREGTLELKMPKAKVMSSVVQIKAA